MNIENVKFKVWDNESKRMSLPLELHFPLVQFVGDSLPLQFVAGKAQTTNRFEFLYFTGLTDKNGVEIYEGDKLLVSKKVADYDDDVFVGQVPVQGIFKVIYDAPCFTLERIEGGLRDWDFYDGGQQNEMTVIGNIYQEKAE